MVFQPLALGAIFSSNKQTAEFPFIFVLLSRQSYFWKSMIMMIISRSLYDALEESGTITVKNKTHKELTP